MNSLLMRMAGMGFRLFPLRSGTKGSHLVTSWKEDASNDTAVITGWDRQYPDANWALVPGPVAVVLDIDNHTAGAARSALAQIAPPRTFCIATPSGGFHLYFLHPGGGLIGNNDASWNLKYPGIDLRADLGYVLIAGNVEGGSYALRDDVPISPLPVHLLRHMPYREGYLDTAEVIDDQGSVCYTKLPSVIPYGSRDTYFWGLACSLAERGYTCEDAKKAAAPFYERCEQPAGKDRLTWSCVEEKIERAHQLYGGRRSVTLPMQLKDVLRRYVYIEDTSSVIDMEAPPRSAVLKLDNFNRARSNIYFAVGDKDKRAPLPKVWLGHPERRSVYSTTYYPGKERVIDMDGAKYYNTYVPSDLSGSSMVPVRTMPQLVHDHMGYLFSSDKELFLKWLAYTVRRAHVRIPWAPVLVSAYQGIGKGWLFRLMSRLMGPENCFRIDPVDLTDQRSNFNEWLGGTLLWIDELDSRYNFYEKLKPLISETYGQINVKYGGKEHRQIFCNVICTSNHDDALRLDMNDRRFWVIYNASKPKDGSYYRRLFNWLDSSEVLDFYRYLHSLDIDDFNWQTVPKTNSAKERMMTLGRSDIELVVLDGFKDEVGIFKYDIVSYNDVWAWVCSKLGLSFGDTQAKRLTSRAVNKLCRKNLPQMTYTAELPVGRKTLRLALIRNSEKWERADRARIVDYYIHNREEMLK